MLGALFPKVEKQAKPRGAISIERSYDGNRAKGLIANRIN
jgi:hypothetical protein